MHHFIRQGASSDSVNSGIRVYVAGDLIGGWLFEAETVSLRTMPEWKTMRVAPGRESKVEVSGKRGTELIASLQAASDRILTELLEKKDQKRAMRWTLEFEEQSLEHRYYEHHALNNIKLLRGIMAFGSLTSGFFLLAMSMQLLTTRSWLLSVQSIVGAFALSVASLIGLSTNAGRRHPTRIVVPCIFVVFALIVASYSRMLVLRAPGQLRTIEGDSIPDCAALTMLNTSTLSVEFVNYTRAVRFGDISAIGFMAQACKHSAVETDFVALVVETRVWEYTNYDYWGLYKTVFNEAFVTWFVFGVFVVLFASMRCVHAVITVALPGTVFGFAFIATSNLPSDIITVVLARFIPALLVVVGMTWKLERADRNIFIQRRDLMRMVKEQETELRDKSMKIRTSESKLEALRKELDAAQMTITRAKAESGAVMHTFELQYHEIDFGVEPVCLGEGSFGQVVLAKFRGTLDCAVKTVRVNRIDERELYKFRKEIVIMAPLCHPNLVKLYGGVWNEGAEKLCIVLEHCAYGSLTAFIGSTDGDWGSSHHGLALGVAQGLSYLHHDLSRPLIHRDMKPDNILVSSDEVAKIGDFGESTLFDRNRARADSEYDGEDARTMSLCGTNLWMAPEIAYGDPYNESVDTWSFALVLLCLAVGDMYHIRKARAGRRYRFDWRPPIPQHVPPALAILIRSMWRTAFRERPSMSEVAAKLAALGRGDVDGSAKNDQAASNTGGPQPQDLGPLALEPALVEEVRELHTNSTKPHAVFISYHESTCEAEARLVERLYQDFFVDPSLAGSAVCDRRSEISNVKDSDVLLLLLSENVFRCPWCLIELEAAIAHGVPIVALNCVGKGYNSVEAARHVLKLETSSLLNDETGSDAHAVLKRVRKRVHQSEASTQ